MAEALMSDSLIGDLIAPTTPAAASSEPSNHRSSEVSLEEARNRLESVEGSGAAYDNLNLRDQHELMCAHMPAAEVASMRDYVAYITVRQFGVDGDLCSAGMLRHMVVSPGFRFRKNPVPGRSAKLPSLASFIHKLVGDIENGFYIGGNESTMLSKCLWIGLDNIGLGFQSKGETQQRFLRAGLKAMEALMDVASGKTAPALRFALPPVWLAFQPKDLLSAGEIISPQGRDLILRAVSPRGEGLVLPDCGGHVGTIREVDADAGTITFTDDFVLKIPDGAVMRWYVTPGTVVESADTSLADAVPQLDYDNWRHFIQTLGGEHRAAPMIDKIVAAMDREHGGLKLRRAELVSEATSRYAFSIYEQTTEEFVDDCSPVQVAYRTASSWVNGPLNVDLLRIPDDRSPSFRGICTPPPPPLAEE